MTPAYVQSRVFVGCLHGGDKKACYTLANDLLIARRRLLKEENLGWDVCYQSGSAVPPQGSVLIGAVASNVEGECDLNLYVYPVRPDAMVLRDRCELPVSDAWGRYAIQNRVASDEPWTTTTLDGVRNYQFNNITVALNTAGELAKDAIRVGMTRVIDQQTGCTVKTFSGGGGESL